MPASPDERDRGERLFCDIGGTTVALQAQDLDPVGLFVPAQLTLEGGTEVALRLRSPIGALCVTAHVVQAITADRARREHKRAGCALVFIGLADDDRAWIGLTLAALGRTSLRAVPRALSGPSRVSRAAIGAAAIKLEPETPAAPVLSEKQRHWQQQRPKIRERLQRELAALEGKLPWELLGIPRDADPATAKQAFLTLSKRYHPHAFARFDCSEISRMATLLFIAHKRAFSRITSVRPPAPNSRPTQPPSAPFDSKRPLDSKRPRGNQP